MSGNEKNQDGFILSIGKYKKVIVKQENNRSKMGEDRRKKDKS